MSGIMILAVHRAEHTRISIPHTSDSLRVGGERAVQSSAEKSILANFFTSNSTCVVRSTSSTKHAGMMIAAVNRAHSAYTTMISGSVTATVTISQNRQYSRKPQSVSK